VPDAIRHSLHDGVTAYFVLSPVTGLVVTVALRILLQSLTPASGRQDHTTSPSENSRARLPRETSAIASRAQRP